MHKTKVREFPGIVNLNDSQRPWPARQVTSVNKGYPCGDRLEAALDQFELMVSIDLYMTETTRWSLHVLPSTSFFERPDRDEMWGANASRPWIQYSDAVIAPSGEARDEYDIYADILSRMDIPSPLAFLGRDNRPDPTPIEAADMMLRAGKWGDQHDADGLSVDRLRDTHPHG